MCQELEDAFSHLEEREFPEDLIKFILAHPRVSSVSQKHAGIRIRTNRLNNYLNPQECLSEVIIRMTELLVPGRYQYRFPSFAWFYCVLYFTVSEQIRKELFHLSRQTSVSQLPEAKEEDLINQIPDLQDTPGIAAAMTECADRIMACLEGLPRKDQDIILLSYIKNYSTDATACVMGTFKGTVLSRRFAALRKLRNCLKLRFGTTWESIQDLICNHGVNPNDRTR